jgi:hypothetical protein
MDTKVLVKTAYGDIALETLVQVYETSRRHNEKRGEWFKTEEGKAYQRQKAKEYYERNKDKVLQKRAEAYQDEEKRKVIQDRNRLAAQKKKAESENNM